MSLWSRVKSFVNRQITRRGAESVSEPPLEQELVPQEEVPSIDYGGPSFFPPPQQQDIDFPWGTPIGVETIVDDYGNTLGTQSFEGWYNDTLLSRNALAMKYYGMNHHQLIELIESEYNIIWDWETWRAQYLASVGA